MANKKDIFNAYGIEYKNGKINSPLGMIKPLLIDGNSKLGKGVYTFSTLPGKQIVSVTINGKSYDVIGTCPCSCAGCYAMTGFYKMPSVIQANAVKTILARNYMEFVKNAIIAQIKAENIRLVRIHASGDFFNAEYVAMWKEIVKACPNTVFWTYTKVKEYETAFDGLDNINIVRSLIPGIGFNFGKCGYILKAYDALKAAGKDVYICRCGIDKNQHCVNCTGCSKNKFVLFIEHSTDYKAENDPLFPVLKALIESQPSQKAESTESKAA